MAQHDDTTAFAVREPEQELAQFEPDPDGMGDLSAAPPPGAADDDPQWIVWDDAAGESAWAAEELTQIPGWRV